MEENTTGSGLRMLPDHRQAPFLHAGFWRRFAAYIIDSLVLSPVFLVLNIVWFFPLVVSAQHHRDAPFPIGPFLGLVVLGIVIPWLYYALMESSKLQATVGKLALGLRVTDQCGRRIGFGRATGRFFGKIISGLVLDIGYMLAGWTARKQALHDLMAGCCVVRREGLAAWENDAGSAAGRGSPAASVAGTGMPGWAVALIVFGCVFFLIVPVLAILAAIAIPAYEAYTVRTQVAQGIELSGRARALVGQYIGERGALPGNNAALGLPRPEDMHAQYVASVRVIDGKVVVTYGHNANSVLRGDHVVISPVGNAAMLQWHCSSPDIRERYLPEECRR